jgi:hypothetical protein
MHGYRVPRAGMPERVYFLRFGMMSVNLAGCIIIDVSTASGGWPSVETTNHHIVRDDFAGDEVVADLMNCRSRLNLAKYCKVTQSNKKQC